MKTFSNILFFINVINIIGCYPMKGIVKFDNPKNDTNIKSTIAKTFPDISQLSILLRVPSTSTSVAEINEYSYNKIYSTIEEELVKNGFRVRDRQLFNELISVNNQSIEKVAQGTETDIIIEIVELDLGEKYKTDNFIKESNGSKVILKNGVINLNGARAKFRFYSIKTNELIGSTEYNYAPCNLGCKYKIDSDGSLYAYRNKNYVRVKDYKIMETDDLEDFIKLISKNLVNNLK